MTVRRLQVWGDNIRTAREGQHLTQDELAKLVDVQQFSVARWESGHTAPQSTIKVALARVLRQDPHDLFPLIDE